MAQSKVQPVLPIALQPPLTRQQLQTSLSLLESLPFPVMEIAPDHAVRWANATAKATYGDCSGPCFNVSHGYSVPCSQLGEPCPKLPAEEAQRPSTAHHAHSTVHGTQFFSVSAIPISGGGVLELHVPVEDVWARDQLTGLYSRDFFERLAHRQLALLARLNAGFATIMIDLDHFKEINDVHGHAAGDQVLRTVGPAISTQIREADAAGRWGGEEFCIFLPDTTADGAMETATRIQRSIREMSLPPPLTELKITASFGVHSTDASDTLDSAVQRADEALYRAKHAGRNQIKRSDDGDR